MPRCLPVFHLLYLPSTNGPFFSLFDVWSFCFYKSRVFFFSYWSFLRIEVLCWNSREGVCFCLRESIRGRAERAVRGDRRERHNILRLLENKQKTLIFIICTDTRSSLWLMFTWHKINSILERRLGLCISFAAMPSVYVCLWPVPAPNFPHHIQSRPANGQLHYSQYLKSPLMHYPAVWSSVSSESPSFKCSCADCGCRW